MKIVDLVWFMWYNGTIPADLVCTILILIPKGNSYTQVIGLLGFLWKVMEEIIDTHIKNDMTFHDIIHVFLHR